MVVQISEIDWPLEIRLVDDQLEGAPDFCKHDICNKWFIALSLELDQVLRERLYRDSVGNCGE